MNGKDDNQKSTKDDELNDLNDENQDEEILSMDDIIKMNESLEREAEALLGGHSEYVCTYPEGYKFRQPLYSCRTCAAENGGQFAGVCYACSGNCHDGHDLVELYTKRKFCCDCGNSKFKSKCKLYEEKSATNPRNKYNHNFDRIYCVCKKVYPPAPDDDTADTSEMHQCCVCEDWFHLSHIFEEPSLSQVVENLQSESADENWELICRDCVTKLPFVFYYEAEIFGPVEKKTANNIQAENSNLFASSLSACKLEALRNGTQNANVSETSPHSIYFKPQWRDTLCRCIKCLNMYEDLECAFFVDPEDTFAFYDAERRRNADEENVEPATCSSSAMTGTTTTTLAAGANGCDESRKRLGDGMENIMYNIIVKKTNNRDAALNAYMGVKEMYNHMGEFFSKCGNGRVITRRDVEQCFEELKAKRPRFSASSADAGADNAHGAWTQ